MDLHWGFPSKPLFDCKSVLATSNVGVLISIYVCCEYDLLVMVLSRLHGCKSIYCNLSVLSNGDNSSFCHLLLFIYIYVCVANINVTCRVRPCSSMKRQQSKT